jgi:hypothetical protein
MRFNTQRRDGFDQFCVERVRAYGSEDSGGAGADAINAVELPDAVRPFAPELSYYGTWSRIPTYGLVWRPHYAGAWNPYLRGYWTASPAGWVWVSYDPWGWAPYHYGRWDYASNLGWFWSPGAVWGGAWVRFAVGPTHIGWSPLNYYNRPVFQDAWAVNRVDLSIGGMDARGWQFLSTRRFGWRGGADTVIVRADRLPRSTPLVMTGSLPRFDPRVIAQRPDRAADLMESVRRDRTTAPEAPLDAEASRPFRVMERRIDRGSRAARRPVGSAPAAVGTRRPSLFRYQERCPVAATAPSPKPLPVAGDCSRPGPTTPDRLPGRMHNPALERLVEGARQPAAEHVVPAPPDTAKPAADAPSAPAKPAREEPKSGRNRRK